MRVQIHKLIIIAFLILSSINCSSLKTKNITALNYTKKNLYGNWIKKCVTYKNGNYNCDPRYEISIHFNIKGISEWSSKSTQEMWLTDGTTELEIKKNTMNGILKVESGIVYLVLKKNDGNQHITEKYKIEIIEKNKMNLINSIGTKISFNRNIISTVYNTVYN